MNIKEIPIKILKNFSGEEEILWKKFESEDQISESLIKIWEGLLLIIIFIIMIIGASLFFIMILIFFSIPLFAISPYLIFKGYQEIKKKKKLLSKQELKNYRHLVIITNKRWIQRNFDNFYFQDNSEIDIKFAYKEGDTIYIDLEQINMVAIEDLGTSYYNIYIYSSIDLNFPTTLFFRLNLDELIECMKVLNNVIRFEQEEHDIYGGITYFRDKQGLPKEFSDILRLNKENIIELTRVVKIT